MHHTLATLLKLNIQETREKQLLKGRRKKLREIPAHYLFVY